MPQNILTGSAIESYIGLFWPGVCAEVWRWAAQLCCAVRPRYVFVLSHSIDPLVPGGVMANVVGVRMLPIIS